MGSHAALSGVDRAHVKSLIRRGPAKRRDCVCKITFRHRPPIHGSVGHLDDRTREGWTGGAIAGATAKDEQDIVVVFEGNEACFGHTRLQRLQERVDIKQRVTVATEFQPNSQPTARRQLFLLLGGLLNRHASDGASAALFVLQVGKLRVEDFLCLR